MTIVKYSFTRTLLKCGWSNAVTPDFYLDTDKQILSQEIKKVSTRHGIEHQIVEMTIKTNNPHFYTS